MTVAYLAAVALAERVGDRQVAGAVVALCAIFLVAPPLLSNDVFDYITYARLGAVHHLNPYVFPPASAPHDAVYRFAHWRETRTTYGPLFTLPSYVLGHVSPGVALWGFKAVSALAELACVGLTARIAGRLGRSRRMAAATFGLNPMVLVWTVGGAHNDTLMLAFVLGAMALVVERRERAAGAALVAGIAIKATAGLALPFALLGATRRRRLLAGAAVATVATVAVAYVGFSEHATRMISNVLLVSHLVSHASLPRLAVILAGIHLSAHVRLALSVLLVGALLGLAAYVRRGGDWIRATGWGFVALAATATWAMPWYLIWPLPMAAITRDRRLLAVILALQVYSVTSYLVLWRA